VIKIFISHSSIDALVAKALAKFLKFTVGLRSGDIRCSSVDEFTYEGGRWLNPNLRNEITKAEVVIGLISENAFKSKYVPFELGARWGMVKDERKAKDKGPILVLAPGVDDSVLQDSPLKDTVFYRAEEQDDLERLGNQALRLTGLDSATTSSDRQCYIDAIIGLRPFVEPTILFVDDRADDDDDRSCKKIIETVEASKSEDVKACSHVDDAIATIKNYRNISACVTDLVFTATEGNGMRVAVAAQKAGIPVLVFTRHIRSEIAKEIAELRNFGIAEDSIIAFDNLGPSPGSVRIEDLANTISKKLDELMKTT